jgi:sortase A
MIEDGSFAVARGMLSAACTVVLLCACASPRVTEEEPRGASHPVLQTTPAGFDHDVLARLSVPDMSDWSETRIAAYEAILHAEGAAEAPEGIMRIPAVDLELPVFAGAQERNLTRGAGRIPGTPPLGEIGNTGIAAHRDGYFRALKDVRLGDEILVETLRGRSRYEIVDLLIVDPTDVHVLDPTDVSALTLVTCYPFYFVGSAPQRYIVRAERR